MDSFRVLEAELPRLEPQQSLRLQMAADRLHIVKLLLQLTDSFVNRAVPLGETHAIEKLLLGHFDVGTDVAVFAEHV